MLADPPLIGGGPRPGRRSASVGRTSSAAVRRDRLRFGREGPGGEGGSGAPAPRALQRSPAPTSPITPGAAGSVLRAFPPRGEGRGPSPPTRASTGADCPQSVSDRAAPPGRGPALVQQAVEVRGEVGHPPDPS